MGSRDVIQPNAAEINTAQSIAESWVIWKSSTWETQISCGFPADDASTFCHKEEDASSFLGMPMLRSRLNAFEQTRADAAPVLDIKDPQAHRHYLYGTSGKDYIGNQRLAWEFLRRSRAYRQDIAAFMERWQAILPDEATHPDRPRFTEEYDALCAKWSLETAPGLIHPDSIQPPQFHDRDCPRTLPPHALHIDGRTIDLMHGDYQDYSPTISVRFFLDAYLGERIDWFRNWVLSEDFERTFLQPHGFSWPAASAGHVRQDDLYPVYLRALDASLAGREPDDICTLLYPPGTKKSVVRIDKLLKRANELADSGYRGLLRLEPFPGKKRKVVTGKPEASHLT